MSTVPQTRPRPTPAAWLLGLTFLVPIPALPAQQGGVAIPERIGPTIAPVVHDARAQGPAAQPPGPWAPRVHAALPPIPPGPATPQNDDPPGHDVQPGAWSTATGQFRFFTNDRLGMQRTAVEGTPTVAQLRDTVLQTGNDYAALSTNSGHDWQELSPHTFFPSLDGGYCCNQRVYYVRSHGIVIWLLQYGYSSSTGRGSFRIAVARDRDALRSANRSQWNEYVLNPTHFGFGSDHALDDPDIAASNDWLHVSANVRNSRGGFVDSVRWRMELDDLAAGRGASMTFRRGSSLTGGAAPFSLRFAEGGDGTSIYYAAFKDTTTLWLFRTTDSGSNVRFERSVNNWTNARASCPGPDGLDWCGDVVGQLRGAFGDTGRIGFLWTSAGNGGSRPLPYSRIVTFDVGNNLTKISDNDQWSNSLTWAYGAAASNSQGHIGIVFAVGGPNSFVHSSATIVDQYQTSFGGMQTVSSGSGTSGPGVNRWGDRFSVQRHPTNSSTFIGTGLRQRGGPNARDSDPHFVWFGRDDYESTDVRVDVESTGITGVPIAIDVRDNTGAQNGQTNFTRVFDPRQGLELTAPLFASSGGTTWVFERWAHKTTPTTGFALKPLGELVLTISDVGSIDDVAQARYLQRRTLDVRSTNPSSGVAIQVSAEDVGGDDDGTTSFTRLYRDGASVTLTAPAAVGFNAFKRWALDGVGQTAGLRTLALTMNASHVATAEYYDNVGGGVREIGAGCPGTSGVAPLHTISWPSGQQGPQQGRRTTYAVSNARANTIAALYFGLNDQVWNGFVLPLDLSFLGMHGCLLFHDILVQPTVAILASGSASVDVTWPVDPQGIGASIFTTWAVVDLGANQLGVVHSNAMETVLGGNR